MPPLDKESLYSEPEMEVHEVGEYGHCIGLVETANDDRQKWAIYDPHGMLVTMEWGREAAERACHQLIETGAIVKGPR